MGEAKISTQSSPHTFILGRRSRRMEAVVVKPTFFFCGQPPTPPQHTYTYTSLRHLATPHSCSSQRRMQDAIQVIYTVWCRLIWHHSKSLNSYSRSCERIRNFSFKVVVYICISFFPLHPDITITNFTAVALCKLVWEWNSSCLRAKYSVVWTP